MDAMPRPRPPHLHRQVTRDGRTVWYVRVGKGPRIRIRSDFGSPEFDADYSAAIANSSRPSKTAPATGSLEWLCERYRAECPKWANFKPATRKQRENIFRAVMEVSGQVAAHLITREHIEAGRDRRKPHQGRHFVDAMRGMFEWATATKLIPRDPTAGVTYPIAPRTKGFPGWTEDDVRKWEEAYPIGTRERVWLDVVLYTGVRRGDAHRIGRQHLRPDGTLSFTTEKTETPVTLPVLPALRRTIEAGPCGDLAFVCQRDGRPYGRKESFGNVFSDTARKLGIKKSLHGIRKIAAQRCAEAGATVHELNSIFGWTGTKMALRYTEAADRKRLAATGMAKLQAAEQNSNSIPSPSGANAPHPDFSIKKSTC
jgi:integrase